MQNQKKVSELISIFENSGGKKNVKKPPFSPTIK